MRNSVIAAALVASLAFLQGVPAPPVFIALGASAATATAMTSGLTSGLVSGSIGASVGAGVACAKSGCRRRQAAFMAASKMARDISSQLDIRDGKIPGPPPAPQGIPQNNWDDCYHDALNAKVNIKGPVGDNHIRIEGLPTTCMVLSTVIDGKVDGGPTPTPCGTACLEYSGMTKDDYEHIRTMVNQQILKPKN
ncbi:hypothetical protein F4821DRAFT_275517 [Hypoxylon rubiginosum]|uniref:Uncharacterized protein n=1 Tax=Hypoxylon rubiginosum TaxID=110542 RepID=A0ACC0DAW5_9PEZI|nr:hypothetical protein F4821DRAFT_275517 [Hypoxylon rubiginosum]